MTRHDVWTVLAILRWTAGFLRERGCDSGRLDAEVLLAHVLGLPRIQLYVQHDRPLTADERAAYRELVKRRAGREPTQYIVGHQEFWSIDLLVEPGVLIPRPETECLVEEVLAEVRGPAPGPARDPAAEARPRLDEHLPAADRRPSPHIADVGTGSGAIAIALATELPDAHVTAGDISPVALRVAAHNADRAGVAERVTVLEADGLLALWRATGERPFDVVASNPPYVRVADRAGLMPEVRDHEPAEALFAGPDGLAVLRPLVADLGRPGVVAPGGIVALEVADGEPLVGDAFPVA